MVVEVKSRRGVTLTEVLVVCAIVTMLVSLSYPVIGRAVESAKISRSKMQMKQIHLALAMYCDAESGPGPNRLGLPCTFRALLDQAPEIKQILRTGGSGWQRPESGEGDAYTWMAPNASAGYPGFAEGPGTERGIWFQHVEATQGNPVVLLDATFPIRFAWMESKRVYGIYLDGHIETRFYAGSVTYHKRWEK